MKKFTALVVSLLMMGAVFAQKIPAGRNLVAAVYDFAQPENWGGIDSVSYDIQNDKLLSLKQDDVYKVNGKVTKLEKNEIGLNQINYEIEE